MIYRTHRDIKHHYFLYHAESELTHNSSMIGCKCSSGIKGKHYIYNLYNYKISAPIVSVLYGICIQYFRHIYNKATAEENVGMYSRRKIYKNMYIINMLSVNACKVFKYDVL